jgi:hypothetical protein
MLITLDHDPPAILQIYRQSLAPGSEAAYAAAERDITRAGNAYGCPHAYLGLEALTGAKEAWFLNGYRSHDEREEVAAAYASNHALMAALTEAAARKAPLTHSPVEVFASHRPDPRGDAAWRFGYGRFAVIAVSREPVTWDGARFDGPGPDPESYFFWAAANWDAAERLASGVGSAARVFTVRPAWSIPEPAWAASDPAFWKRSY